MPAHLLEFVQVIGLLVEVESQQFALQVFYERLTAEEVPDDTMRKRVTVQLQISCTQRTTSCRRCRGRNHFLRVEPVTGEFVVFSLRTVAVVTFVTPRLTQILLQLLVLEQRAQLGRFVTTLLFLLFCWVSHALSSFGCHGRNFPNRDNGEFKLILTQKQLVELTAWKRSAVADRWRFNAAKPLFPERRLTGWKIPFYWVILNFARFCIIIPQVKATTRKKSVYQCIPCHFF